MMPRTPSRQKSTRSREQIFTDRTREALRTDAALENRHAGKTKRPSNAALRLPL
jgi:hypothetical protein